MVLILLVAVALLCIPLLAMQFTNEVNWTVADFIIAGLLLFVTGLVFDFILRKVKKTRQRILAISVLILTFILVWAELAVGIFNTVFAGH